MTCQDCIHYKNIGTLCDKYIYPEERNNEPCDYFKRKSACDDCIYTYPDCPTGEIDKEFDEVHGDGFNVVSCVNYVNNDGSYHDGHWHCHRCGKIVEVAGLCYECDKWLSDNPVDESWESVSK